MMRTIQTLLAAAVIAAPGLLFAQPGAPAGPVVEPEGPIPEMADSAAEEHGAVETPDHGEEGHEGGGGSALLNPDLGTAIWTILLFGVLLLVLGKFVWPPILNGLQARENKIRSDIAEAERANRDAQQTLQAYEHRLSEAQAEARKMIEQSRADAERLRAKLVADTETDIQRIRERASQEIRLAKQQAIQDLYAQAGNLATAVAGKILQRQITEADTRQLVEQSLKELDRSKAV